MISINDFHSIHLLFRMFCIILTDLVSLELAQVLCIFLFI